jgi:hypothetical protein
VLSRNPRPRLQWLFSHMFDGKPTLGFRSFLS